MGSMKTLARSVERKCSLQRCKHGTTTLRSSREQYMSCDDPKRFLTRKQTKNFKCTQKCVYFAHASPQPFFNYTTAIIANHHLSQWFPVQSPHTSAAILFCDITNLQKTSLWISSIERVELSSKQLVSLCHYFT